MPTFLCPCCGDSYVVPLAACEFLLDAHRRQGWRGPIAPALCPSCDLSITEGDLVTLRKGSGVTAEGARHDLLEGSRATVVEVSTWEGEGSIYRVRLAGGEEIYVARPQLALEPSDSEPSDAF